MRTSGWIALGVSALILIALVTWGALSVAKMDQENQRLFAGISNQLATLQAQPASTTTSPAVSPTVAATSAPEETQEAEEVEEAAPAQPAAAPVQNGLVNTLGHGSEAWLQNIGVLTGEPGDEACKTNVSCWWINPDNQVKMTLDGQTTNLDEGAFLMCSFGGGTFAIGDALTMEFEFVEFHQWFLVIRGAEVGTGDRNVPVKVTGIAEGFVLCTNLPPGAYVSEGYVLQNVEYGYHHECGEWDHCTSSTLVLVDINRPHDRAVLHQPDPKAPWQPGAGGKIAASN